MKIDQKVNIMYQQWDVKEPKAAVLFIHGMGAHSGRWDFFAQKLSQAGICSYALELKGFGETQDLKGHIDSFQTYFNDICALRDTIAQQYPKLRIFMLGESLGGLLSFLLAIDKPKLFNGLICISPAFKSTLKYYFWDYLQVFWAVIFKPKKQFKVRFNAQMCTRDLEYQKTMENDTREHRLASAQLLVYTLAFQMQAESTKQKLSIPVLFLIPGKDSIADSSVSRKVFNGLTVKDKILINYSGNYHSLSIDIGKEKVFDDILNWLNKRY